MSALGAAPARQPAWPTRLLRPRGVLVAALVVAAAWIAMIALGDHGHAMHHGSGGAGAMVAAPAMDHGAMSGMDGMNHGAMGGAEMGAAAQPSAAASADDISLAVALPLWLLMTIAMMGPAALPALRHVALNSLRWRRGRALATFAAVYLGLWLAVGAVVLLARPLWDGVEPALALTVGLALAAAWQLTTPKRRALNDCHRTSPLPPRGRRAAVGVARFGLLNGGACVRSCWPLMLVMALASSGALLWMAGLTALVTFEKLSEHPRRATRHAAALLGVATIGAGAAALIA